MTAACVFPALAEFAYRQLELVLYNSVVSIIAARHCLIFSDSDHMGTQASIEKVEYPWVMLMGDLKKPNK